ncbi:MAG: hypothetical protein EBZ40_09690, partial [Gammaproteobacteria bacterium]|nr:hypothetical protein [Gammaproteobacteria bacterium]
MTALTLRHAHTPFLFGVLWYTFPSLPTIFRPRHWFAGNGGLFRDVYFAVVCSSHDFDFLDVAFFDFLDVDFLDVDFFDFLGFDFDFGFDFGFGFEALGLFDALGALGLFEGREADLTLGLFEGREALDFRTDIDLDFGFGLDFDFGAERAPDLAETRTGIWGVFFSWGLELRFFNGPRIKKNCDRMGPRATKQNSYRVAMDRGMKLVADPSRRSSRPSSLVKDKKLKKKLKH